MMTVALVGWRGLVGSVLVNRMREEKDFEKADFTFFSTSSPGKEAPSFKGLKPHPLGDAFDTELLKKFDIIMTCQGSDYTKKIHPKLRESGWNGYWIDAASHLRMEPSSTLVLDPVNGKQIQESFHSKEKDFVGANCTVSLMMLAIDGLLKKDLIEWIHTSSYQAISGSGSKAIEALFEDLNLISSSTQKTSGSLLDKINSAHKSLSEKEAPRLGANILPWIDSEESPGKTREETKGEQETNKILGKTSPLPVDGTCVRVPVLRSHSQTLTLSLKEDISEKELEDLLTKANPWVKIVPNKKEETLHGLTPTVSSSTLDILVGRVRKLELPGRLYEVFTVGDQLLWGAAEPVRRAFQLTLDFLDKKR